MRVRGGLRGAKRVRNAVHFSRQQRIPRVLHRSQEMLDFPGRLKIVLTPRLDTSYSFDTVRRTLNIGQEGNDDKLLRQHLIQATCYPGLTSAAE